MTPKYITKKENRIDGLSSTYDHVEKFEEELVIVFFLRKQQNEAVVDTEKNNTVQKIKCNYTTLLGLRCKQHSILL